MESRARATPDPDARTRKSGPDESAESPGGLRERATILSADEFRRRVLFVAATSLGVGLLLIGFQFVAETVVLVFAGCLLATLFHAPSRWLGAHLGVPKLPALALVIAGLFCLLAGGATLFGYQVAGEADRLIQSVSEAATETRSSLERYDWGRRLLQAMGDGVSWARALGGGVISGTPHMLFALGVVFFEGPDPYASAGGIASRVSGLTAVASPSFWPRSGTRPSFRSADSPPLSTRGARAPPGLLSKRTARRGGLLRESCANGRRIGFTR